MADTPVSPTNVTALPTAPNRNTQTNPLTYSQTADAWAGALPTWTTQVNNIAANVNFNADSAFDSAAEALASKNAAEAAEAAAIAATNATQWVSGQAYDAGDVVYSPINFLSYRANTNTSGTTDPSLSANWTPLNEVDLSTDAVGTLPVANGGTGATTLTANNVLLGNGTSAVQVVAPGASGNVLTSNGTTWSSSAIQAGITNVVTATSSTTLTSTPTLLKFSPTSNAQKITLPNATSMSKGANAFVIDVSGGYQATIVDNGGNVLAWTPKVSGSEVVVHLIDNTTSNGVWGFDGVDYWGLEVDQDITFTSKIDTSNSIYTSAIELDSSKTLILASNSNLQAVVYDKSTNTFGSAVLVRNAATISNFYVGLISSTSALVVSAASANNLEGVVLSISGTTITVNTAGTYTLTGGGHLSSSGGYRNLVAFGTSWIYLGNSASAGAVIPIGVSGTTVTFGTPVATTGLQVGAVYAVTSSVALVVTQNSTSTIYAECFTVSGSTATKNSNVSISSNIDGYLIEQIGSRWAIVAINGANATGNIISVAGTTPSNSSVTLIAGSSTLTGGLYYHKIGSQLICSASLASKGYINVLTDSSGTAVAGTQQLIGVGTTAALYYMGGNSAEAWWRNQVSATDNFGVKVTISGNNPVVSTLWRSQYSATNISSPTPSAVLIGSPLSGSSLMWSSYRAIHPRPGMTYSADSMSVENGMIAFQDTYIVKNTGLNRMLNDSTVWAVVSTENSAAAAGTSTKYRVQKARVV